MIQKVIKPNGQISISDLIEDILENDKKLCFYRSKNEKEGIPCFLKVVETSRRGTYEAFFTSPYFGYRNTYVFQGKSKNEALKLTLEAAMGAREVYFCDDMSQIFKVQQKQ